MTNVLVIDDDEFVGNSVRTILELEGYTVELASTGRAGWRRCRRAASIRS